MKKWVVSYYLTSPIWRLAFVIFLVTGSQICLHEGNWAYINNKINAEHECLKILENVNSLLKLPEYITDFQQMSVQFSQFFCYRFFWKLPCLFKHVFLNVLHFSIWYLHWKLLISISGSFNWDNNCKFLSKYPKTIARKMLFSWEHLRKVGIILPAIAGVICNLFIFKFIRTYVHEVQNQS